MEFRFPSAEFPPLTSVAITMPDGWEADPSAPALMVVFDGASPEGFRTNVMLKVDRVPGSSTLELVGAELTRSMDSDAGFVLQGEEMTSIGGRPAMLRAQTITVEDYPHPLFQTQCLVLVPTAIEASADLVVVHATCAGEHAEQYGTVFRSIFDSMRFG